MVRECRPPARERRGPGWRAARRWPRRRSPTPARPPASALSDLLRRSPPHARSSPHSGRHHAVRDRRITFLGRRGDRVELGGDQLGRARAGPPPTAASPRSPVGAQAGRSAPAARRHRPAAPRSPAARTPATPRRVSATAPRVHHRFDVPARPIRRQQHTHFATPISVGSGFGRHYAARPGA